MRSGTYANTVSSAMRTMDEQDPHNPYKKFPSDREYHDWLHGLWEKEPILFIEKSGTMMTSRWMAVEATRYVTTKEQTAVHNPSATLPQAPGGTLGTPCSHPR